MKTVLKKFVAVIMFVSVVLSIMAISSNYNNNESNSHNIYADNLNWSAFDVKLTTNDVVKAGSSVTFKVTINNTTNQTLMPSIYKYYYREAMNSEQYSGVDFGVLTGEGLTEYDSITIPAKSEVTLFLSGKIPNTWNGLSEIAVVVDASNYGCMGQYDYKADPNDEPIEEMTTENNDDPTEGDEGDHLNWSAFDVNLTTNDVVKAGSLVTFKLTINNTTNQTLMPSIYKYYYREAMNSEQYPGVDFGVLTGEGLTEYDSIAIPAKSEVTLFLSGKIPNTWNGLSEITVVVNASNYGCMGQYDYKADPNYIPIEEVTTAGKSKATVDAVVTTKSKSDNTFRIKAKTAKIKYRKLKKKTQKISVNKVINFLDKGQGVKKYKKVKGNKGITINRKSGKVTVDKKLKKGTYKVKMKVMALGNDRYKSSEWETITFKIKIS